MIPLLVVIDTNVWISGLFWKGTASKVIEKVYTQEFTPCFSEATFDEWRKKIEVLVQMTEQIDLYLQYRKYLQKNAFFVQPVEQIKICRDPEDDKFLEVAATVKANFLISGDKDLLILKKFHQTKIVSPKQILQILRF